MLEIVGSTKPPAIKSLSVVGLHIFLCLTFIKVEAEHGIRNRILWPGVKEFINIVGLAHRTDDDALCLTS